MAKRKIGILTSGGDGPGMNAAIRSIVRSGLSRGVEAVGIIKGFQGLIDGDIISLGHRSVSNIINRGGTILKTARSEAFKTENGLKAAVATVRKFGIDGLIVIGGDGSYRGAQVLHEQFQIPVICLPGTIDNDLFGTDQTIGCQTAVNTALEAIDKIRDTANSMERIFVIEVMGNRSGYIALEVAVGAGAEDVLIPERKFDYELLCRNIVEGNKKGKISWMIVTAEGAAKAPDVASKIHAMTGLETRFVVLGHIQRGGVPVGADRILATRLGAKAVELLVEGVAGKAIGVIKNEINVLDLPNACKRENTHVDEYLNLIKILR